MIWLERFILLILNGAMFDENDSLPVQYIYIVRMNIVWAVQLCDRYAVTVYFVRGVLYCK